MWIQGGEEEGLHIIGRTPATAQNRTGRTAALDTVVCAHCMYSTRCQARYLDRRCEEWVYLCRQALSRLKPSPSQYAPQSALLLRSNSGRRLRGLSSSFILHIHSVERAVCPLLLAGGEANPQRDVH